MFIAFESNLVVTLSETAIPEGIFLMGNEHKCYPVLAMTTIYFQYENG